MHALKKQRKRERRKAHAKQADERNRARGFTTGDLRRHGDNEGKARAASVVGRQTPSYHKPKPVEVTPKTQPTSGPHLPRLHRDEVELKPTPEVMSVEIFDELRAEARKKRKAFGKVAEGAGWTLAQGGFKNKPEDWSR